MKKTLITLAILAALIVSLFAIKHVFAKNNNDTDYQQFMSNRSKAWEFKYEEITKKKQASLLIAEAEQARLQKEKLLWIANQASTWSTNSWEDWKLQ